MKKIIIALLFLGTVQIFGQWEKCRTPMYGSFNSIAIEDSLIATSTLIQNNSERLVLFSTDKGENWSISSYSPPIRTKLVEIDNEKIFHVTNKGVLSTDDLFETNNLEIYKKVDEYLYQWFLRFDDRIFISTLDGLYSKIDGNSAWNKDTSIISDYERICLAKSKSNLYAGVSDGLFQSTDKGKTWNKISDVNITNGVDADASSLVAINDSIIYLSNDRGESWIEISDNIPENITFNSLKFVDGVIYVGTNSGLYISADNGNSWNNNIVDKVNINQVIDGGDKIMCARDLGGIFTISKNDMTSDEIGPFVNSANVYLIKHNKIYSGRAQALFSSSDHGKTWNYEKFETEKVYDATILNDRIVTSVFTNVHPASQSSNKFGVFFMEENAKYWQWWYMQITIGPFESIAAYNNELLIASPHGVYSFSFKDTIASKISNLNNANTIAVFDNVIIASSSMYGTIRSSDGGETWEGISTFSEDVDYVKIDNTVFCVDRRTKKVYAESSDLGLTWEKITEYAKIPEYTSNREDINFKVIDYKFNMTTDNGSSWIDVNQGLDSAAKYVVVMDDYIIAETDMGIFRAKISELTSTSVAENPVNQAIILYPNPAKNEFTLDYNSPIADKAEIFITDILGNKISTLYQDYLVKGNNILTFSLPKNVSSGSYFITIEHKGVKYSKMLLIKK